MRVILPGKKQGVVFSPPFDFTALCVAGDVLSAPVVTVSVWTGVDASPQNVYAGATAIAGLVASPKLTGGVVGVIYLVKVQVTTSLSGTLILTGLLAVIPDGP